jgi:hypothetical protein
MAGAAFKAGRIVPQGVVVGTAAGLGGNGKSFVLNVVKHGSLGFGDGRLPAAVLVTSTE